jgi:alkanesulfonate monooxygenase SsuD/methylene tetrahydromethanopterin reductase-like flavin-dependent oxidoreductase (luciferase family)
VGYEEISSVGMRFGDPATVLSFVAGLTVHARLIPRVVVLPLRSPFAIAQAFATLDSVSGGRVTLGVGVGHIPEDFAMLGVPFSRRGVITDEYLSVILSAWEGNARSARSDREEGTHAFSLLIKPLQVPRPPIWIGGNTKFALQRAVKFGDGWTPSAYPYNEPTFDRVLLTPGELANAVEWARLRRHELGKANLHVNVSSGPPLRLTRTRHHRDRKRKDVTQFSCVGTASELAEEFSVYRAAGASSFSVNFPQESLGEYLRAAEAFATTVWPMAKV